MTVGQSVCGREKRVSGRARARGGRERERGTRTHLAERALLLLVQCAEADRARVARAVVARRDGPVDDGLCADEADGVVVGRLAGLVCGLGHGARVGVDLEDALRVGAGGGGRVLALRRVLLLLKVGRAILALVVVGGRGVCVAVVVAAVLLCALALLGARLSRVGRGRGGWRGGRGRLGLSSRKAAAESCTARHGLY